MSRMPSFAWQGRCLDGTTRWGIVPATDSAQLRRHLRGRGVALEHSVAVPGWLDGLLAPTTRAIRPRHRAVLLRALATMVSAGIPLHEALEIIGRQEKHAGLRRLIGLLRQDVANGLPLLACNRVGFEPAPDAAGPDDGIQFWGSSFACGPQGELLAEASDTAPQDLLVDIDLSRAETVRRIWPFFRDRRIDAYGDLLKRWRD